VSDGKYEILEGFPDSDKCSNLALCSCWSRTSPTNELLGLDTVSNRKNGEQQSFWETFASETRDIAKRMDDTCHCTENGEYEQRISLSSSFLTTTRKHGRVKLEHAFFIVLQNDAQIRYTFIPRTLTVISQVPISSVDKGMLVEASTKS